jgi:hypothetical protein
MSTDFRIRSTHVGSLVRPDELIAYMHAIDAGEAYDQRAYEECLTRSVRDVVRRQRDTGVDVVSDGEYGKSCGTTTSTSGWEASSCAPTPPCAWPTSGATGHPATCRLRGR